MEKIILYCCFYFNITFIFSQENPLLFQAEYHTGSIVPNYRDYPNTGLLHRLTFNVLQLNENENQDWKIYFKHPETGVKFNVGSFGNQRLNGYEFSFAPYVGFHTSQNKMKSWDFIFGLGLAYHTKYFKEKIPSSLALGSPLNMSFHIALYKHLLIRKNWALLAGGSYLHSSNAHVQLPNFGLNSAAFSLAFRQSKKPIEIITNINKQNYSNDPRKTYFVQLTTGVGVHELGSTSRPIGGEKKLIYSTSVSGAIQWRKAFKLRTGFAYRYYNSYHDYIVDNNISELKDNVNQQASHIHFLLGFEFLFGHFGADIEGGLGLYRPFFKVYSKEYENYPGFAYWLKKLFPSHLSVNYYLIHPNKLPRQNFFIGANVSANFGQADFAEFVIGGSYRLR